MEKDHGCAATMANNIQDNVGVHGAKINVGVDGVPFDTTPAGGDVHREVEASCANDVGTSASLRFDATPGGMVCGICIVLIFLLVIRSVL